MRPGCYMAQQTTCAKQQYTVNRERVLDYFRSTPLDTKSSNTASCQSRVETWGRAVVVDAHWVRLVIQVLQGCYCASGLWEVNVVVWTTLKAQQIDPLRQKLVIYVQIRIQCYPYRFPSVSLCSKSFNSSPTVRTEVEFAFQPAVALLYSRMSRGFSELYPTHLNIFSL